MKAIGKGLLVVAITLILAVIFVRQASAGTEGELRQLLEGKSTIYQGTCHLKNGLFSEAEVKDYTVHRCIVGVDFKEQGELYYALIFAEGNKPVKLIRVNKDVKPHKQDVLWTSARTL